MADKARKHKINPKRRKFCELYATDREFFGNGIESYGEAYDIDITTKKGYNVAKSAANRLLTNVDVLAYINELLDLTLNEAHVDKQLAMLITQNADFGAKMGAIREFNVLRKRVTKKIEGDLNLNIKVVNYGESDNTNNGDDNATS